MKRFWLRFILGTLHSIDTFFGTAAKVVVSVTRALVGEETSLVVTISFLILYYLVGAIVADELGLGLQGWLYIGLAPFLLVVGIGVFSGSAALIAMHVRHGRQALRAELLSSDPRNAFEEACAIGKELPCSEDVIEALASCRKNGSIVPNSARKSAQLSLGVAYLSGKQEGRLMGNLPPLSMDELEGELRAFLGKA